MRARAIFVAAGIFRPADSGRTEYALSRTGAFWQDDYWDRFIRNEEHYVATIGYIDQNPVKAGLAGEARQWAWGSARFSA